MTSIVHPRLRLRAGLVLATCLATVAAMLSLGGSPARADDPCYLSSPWTIQVSGPNGDSTTQPSYAPVQLTALDSTGHPVSTVCHEQPLDVEWSQQYVSGTDLGMHGAVFNPAGNTASVEAAGEGVMTYTVLWKSETITFAGAQLTVTYADPGPSATTLGASPAAPVANSPVTLAATTTSPSEVRSWTWDFGDGNTDSTAENNPSVDHTYTAPGDYTAKVTVTDWEDKSDSVTVAIHVAADPRAPLTAAFSMTPSTATTLQDVAFDGRTSTTDQSGSVTGWSWDFGDGTTGTGSTPSHPYTTAGTYTVTETVTDSLNRTATTTHDVTVHDPVVGGPPVTSGGPHAAWTMTTTSPIAGALTAFDGTSSTDDGGTIVDYAWKFGDGQTAAGATPRHRFGDGGSYPVTLTVTDDAGRTSSATTLVTVAYAPPVAAFSWGPAAPVAGSALTFDGSTSTAAVGGIATYAWDFGDGLTSSDVKPAHTYKVAGNFPVTLTVTDAAGHTASAAQVVRVQWPATDLAVSVGGSAPTAGQYTYRVTVKNLGHGGAHGIQLTNALDPSQMLASKVTAPTGVTCGGVALGATGTITCKAPSAVLAAGKSWVVTFTVKQPLKTKARQVTETSVVRAANPDGVTNNNTARLTTAV